MPRPSPFARGFRALRREPSVLLVEIAWRWIFGGIAAALIAWAMAVFLRSVAVSKGNEYLLRSLNPTVMGYALREILHGKWARLIRLSLIVGASLSVLWILTASVARTATTRVLLEHVASEYGETLATRSRLRTVGALQFVRVMLLWIGFAIYLASAFVAALLTSNADETNTGAFLLLFVCMFGVSAVLLSFFNWVLLLAPIFALRDALPFSSATAAAWRLTRSRAGSLSGLNLAHLVLRLVWFVFMSGVAVVPLGFVRVFPGSVVFLAMLVITLAYCAVADALFVARYAGYIEIAEQERRPEPRPLPVSPPEPISPYAGGADLGPGTPTAANPPDAFQN